MKATFYGKAEGNHTGFVRIKTGRISSKKEEIILPFDVDVSAGNSVIFFSSAVWQKVRLRIVYSWAISLSYTMIITIVNEILNTLFYVGYCIVT